MNLKPIQRTQVVYKKDPVYNVYKVPVSFPLFNSDQKFSTKDIQLLDECVIEQAQDDDVDTDSDILNYANNSCIHDLERGFRRVRDLSHKTDKSKVNKAMLNNARIKFRTERPDFYDRNGLVKP